MSFENHDNLIEQIKSASNEELDKLSTIIREDLLKYVSKNGGHLASNLGVVELTVALHKVFDTPKDKIIFDVGHQSYVHKMLTGRWEAMEDLRQHGGISGFPKISESPHDMYDSGHSGTSVSAALGYAKARDLSEEDYSCIAVIGDGALTGGVAYEALNAAGSDKTPLIVILNDNGMSIRKNVGGMSKHLRKLRVSESYISFKEKLKSSINNNSRLYLFLKALRDKIKYTLLPNTVFEELGFKYYGPIDGHSFAELVPTLEAAKALKRPVLIHVITKKGMGYIPAMNNAAKFHGIGPFDAEKETAISIVNENSWSEIFGEAVLKYARKDNSVAAVSAAMIDSTGLKAFKDEFPERVFDAGIAEQHGVSFAAGLALNGKKPVVAIYSTFLQRAYDQILTEVCLMKLPVIFAIDRAGITGQDGETHQGVFDIAYLSSMPGMTILSPKNADELDKMLGYAFSLGTPCAIRYPRGCAPKTDFGLSSDDMIPEQICDGKDTVILSDGGSLENCMEASELLLKRGISAAVLNMKKLKPLDFDNIEKKTDKFSSMIIVEDGVICGGFGEKIAAHFSESGLKRVLCLGWPDKFIEHGKPEELQRIYGLNAAAIADKTEAFLEKKA